MHIDKSQQQNARAYRAHILSRVEAAARSAGEIALRLFRPGERTAARISYKNGGSPVTEADLAVDRYLLEAAGALVPDAGWLSEETADTPARLAQKLLFVVDPIDGTAAYTRGDPSWAVSIALIEDGRPVVGVVHAPALGRTFSGAAGAGAFLNGAPLVTPKREGVAGASVIAPRGLHPALTARDLIIAPRIPSLALRLVDIAAGRHDLVITTPNARDWDIAAADVILAEAGAALSEADAEPLVYNRSSLARGMLIAAEKSLMDESVRLARHISEGCFHS
jgi:myo-inositol-1(or 4)-monophosphatase